MVQLGRWVDREWTFTARTPEFPAILERVRGTVARAEELVCGVPEEVLSRRHGGRWGAKEHLGHLIDLGELDSKRLSEFLAGEPTLSAADMKNRRTESAGHALRRVHTILAGLREHRRDLVERLERLETVELERTAVHPRLKQPMRLIDWVEFVAHHDDHHLAQARMAIRADTLDDGATTTPGGE